MKVILSRDLTLKIDDEESGYVVKKLEKWNDTKKTYERLYSVKNLKGNIVMDNPSEMLLKDQDVREFYLGMNPEGTNRKSFRDVKHYKRKKRWLS